MFCWFQTGVELELADSQALLEWFANNYKTFGESHIVQDSRLKLLNLEDDKG